MTMDVCVYCEEYKPVVVWDKTGEKVCRDCRHDFVDQEFDEKADVALKELVKRAHTI